MPGDPFYKSPEWRRFRAAVLQERPRCQVAGCPRASCHVDHIRSLRKGGAPFDQANTQALCHPHHSVKTARLDHPGRKANLAPLRAHGCDADGWPLSPEPPWRR